MTKKDAVKWFKETYPNGTYDYWTVQFDWAMYVDSLHKDGLITDRQISTWATPFPYGKRVTFFHGFDE